ncbi:hypothetical protein HYDPIDRAFT_105852 [Hydnomerulius pinastri MD-312]|nr:hypothetical protein HYDPIDRAFT_105852 [Hydnomerulius pinastri MD-312]
MSLAEIRDDHGECRMSQGTFVNDFTEWTIARPSRAEEAMYQNVNRNSYSFLEAAQIEHSSEEHRDLKRVIQRLSREQLDPDKHLEEQAEDDVDRVIAEAQIELPWLTRYEESWVTRIYLKRVIDMRRPHLGGRCKRPESQSAASSEHNNTQRSCSDQQSSWQLAPEEWSVAAYSEYADDDKEDDTTDVESGNGSLFERHLARLAHEEQAAETRQGTAIRDYMSRSCIQRSRQQQRYSRRSSTYATRRAREVVPLITQHSPAARGANRPHKRPPAIASQGRSSSPVKAFLRSMQPNLEKHLDEFIALGMTDQDTLEAFLAWPRGEQEAWLLKESIHLQLTSIQIAGFMAACAAHKEKVIRGMVRIP